MLSLKTHFIIEKRIKFTNYTFKLSLSLKKKPKAILNHALLYLCSNFKLEAKKPIKETIFLNKFLALVTKIE